jgi:ferredoxin
VSGEVAEPSATERVVHGLRIVIDRDQCVGFGDCVKEAPEAFKLDDETIAVFTSPEFVERERLLRACDVCPVDAITVWDESGRQIIPTPPKIES